VIAVTATRPRHRWCPAGWALCVSGASGRRWQESLNFMVRSRHPGHRLPTLCPCYPRPMVAGDGLDIWYQAPEHDL